MDHSELTLTRHMLLCRLKPIDIEIMKRLGTRVNLIPIIAKADTLTQADLAGFKQRVRLVRLSIFESNAFMQIRAAIEAQGIRIYQPPIEEDDAQGAEHARALAEAMPFSVIGSTEDVTTADGRTVKGRQYLWGVAEGAPFQMQCFCASQTLRRS